MDFTGGGSGDERNQSPRFRAEGAPAPCRARLRCGHRSLQCEQRVCSPSDRGPTMAEDPSFQDLLRRVRQRDEQAAAELVRRYEPTIRLAVRVRLTDPRLRRLLDSVDICQSILANFFVRAAAGQFDLERSEQLVKL